MTEPMLARYHRWVFEKFKFESVETLREWVIQESQFQTQAYETVKGLTKGEGRPDQSYRPRTFFSESTTSKRKQRPCPVCRDNHGIYNCEMFNKMDVPLRWDVTKQLKLCFRCLSGGHQGFQCRQSRTCAVNGCRGNHHRLLHLARAQDSRSNSQTLTVRLSPERESKQSAHQRLRFSLQVQTIRPGQLQL